MAEEAADRAPEERRYCIEDRTTINHDMHGLLEAALRKLAHAAVQAIEPPEGVAIWLLARKIGAAGEPSGINDIAVKLDNFLRGAGIDDLPFLQAMASALGMHIDISLVPLSDDQAEQRARDVLDSIHPPN